MKASRCASVWRLYLFFSHATSRFLIICIESIPIFPNILFPVPPTSITVVPPNQAEAMYKSVVDAGVKASLVMFEGEQV